MSESIEDLNANSLSLVAELASELSKLNADIAIAEMDLANLNAKRRAIEESRLPEAMNDLGLSQIKLESGESITVKPEFHASIPVAKRPQAYAWLRDHGFADLLTNKLSVDFGKGEDESARELLNELIDRYQGDRKVDLAETIHPSRLKSLVREQYEIGEPIPEDLFGVYVINRAVIKTK